ncbi:unnamed protein product [Ilex paraguariensis]|uniref:Rad21/Rec8-like protein N-terminal domain-containing protein n=1 Tax=Ilex paraguariensis TaxID=185542 RepID=A0ABC8SYP4_9AQUA
MENSILFPDVPIALRLSSHLLLGVVRIYSRKVNYLFDDCSEALLKVKQAFRSTAVDLPAEESTAPYHSITLPETFDLDDFELPDNDIFHCNFVDHHVSSREQITLQDTMEGVVYSRSQFGLDERFGDGDTSGLELDEELLLDKGAAAGHAGFMLSSGVDPLASVQPITPLNQDEAPEGMTANTENVLTTGDVNQIEGVFGDTDFAEFAQAPSTPGLVQEPNLSSVQETSACDDPLESEDHNLTEFVAKESLENTLCKSDIQHGNQNVVDWSSNGDVNPDTVTSIPAEQNRYHLGDMEINQIKSQWQSSALADQGRTISLVSELSDSIIAASGGPYREQDLRSDIVNTNKPVSHSIDASHEDHVEPQGVGLSEITPDMSGLRRTCQQVSEGFAENTQTSLKTEVSNRIGITGNMEESCFISDASELIAESNRPDLQNPEIQPCQEPKDSRFLNIAVHAEMACTETPVIRPCNLHQPDTLNPGSVSFLDPDSPSEVARLRLLETSGSEEAPHTSEISTVLQGDGYHGAGGLGLVLEENNATEPVSCESIQAPCSKSNDQADNLISGYCHLENSSTGSGLPALEKLLSIPEGLADPPSNLLVAATPDKGDSAGADGDGAGSNIMSGKKRSFTESTLTVQSLDSVESLDVVWTKRTAEPIPDDDDLLSSILGMFMCFSLLALWNGARRSSVLKLKPTPLAGPEIMSMKRPRSAPRITASKRKVLTDDTMVLHGEYVPFTALAIIHVPSPIVLSFFSLVCKRITVKQ